MKTWNGGRSVKEKIEVAFLSLIFIVGSLSMIYRAYDYFTHGSENIKKNISNPEVSFKNEGILTEYERREINSDYQNLLKLCPGISKYTEDISEVFAVSIDAYPYQIEDQGWKRQSYFEIVLKQNLDVVPREFKAWGQHCHFSVGVNGMYLSKKACKAFCGLQDTSPDISEYYAF